MSRAPDVVCLVADGRADPVAQTSGRHRADRFGAIGSVTKTFTATLMQVMVDGGDLDPDSRVSEHLAVDVDAGITVRQLAEHTSGLRRLPPGARRWSRDPYAHVDDGRMASFVADLGRHTVAVPGSRAEYSNLGYAVLGAVLAEVAGTSWAEAVVTRVPQPLDLPDRVVLVDDVPADQRIDPLDRRGRPVDPWTMAAMAPAGGLWTTARALGAYTRAVVVDEIFGPPRWGWRRSDGMTWHNGAVRRAAAFAGVLHGTGRWAVAHGVGVEPDDIDAVAVRELMKEDGPWGL